MRVLVVLNLVVLCLHAPQHEASASASQAEADSTLIYARAFQDAQRSFYNGDYAAAAAATVALRAARPDDLAVAELRSSTLLFQIKRALRQYEGVDKATAWKQCAECPALLAEFVAETQSSKPLAQARVKLAPKDEEALFLLGKLNLNYVWLQLGTLGRKTGWDEYWEARRSLDEALKFNPSHGRARLARAWVDYIVGTDVPWSVRWLLGGGNKKRGLAVVRDVVEQGDSDFFVHTEALFALWDMQVRERDMAAAVVTARRLTRDFPDNRELRRFLASHDAP